MKKRCLGYLHCLKDIVLGHEAQMISGTREALFLIVGTAHTAADHHVKPFQIAFLVCDDDQADVIRVQINRIVPWHGHRNLELAGQVAVAIQGLDLVLDNDARAAVMGTNLFNVPLLNVALPVLDGHGFFVPEPYLGEGSGLGLEELGKDLAVFLGILVVGTSERGRGAAHVTDDITTGLFCLWVGV